MMKLIVKAKVNEGDSEKEYTYQFDQPVVTIGRLKENDIQLPLSTVSGYHAQVLQESPNYYLVDRGSINGTYLNGQRIPPAEKKLLTEGDKIRIQTFDIFFSSGMVAQVDPGATVKVARQMVMEVLGSSQNQTQERPHLIVMGGPNNGKQVELTEGKTVFMGRAKDADIVIDHPSVSRKHAEVVFGWSGALVKDNKTPNGVYCNDQRITGSHKLHDRDEIKLGQQSSSNPIRIIFSHPAEALLSKIEAEQITDGNPLAEKKQVTGSDLQKIEDVNLQMAQESNLPAPVPVAPAPVEVPAVEEPKAIEAPQPVSLEQTTPAGAKKKSRAGLIAVVILFLAGVGALAMYLLPRLQQETPPQLELRSGSPGDMITITGKKLDKIRKVMMLSKELPIVEQTANRIQIKLPEFPHLSAREYQTEIELQGDQGILGRLPFKLSIAPEIVSIDPASGKAGTEVRIQTTGGTADASVHFGPQQATIVSRNGNELVVTVPSVQDPLPPEGLQVPVTVRAGNIVGKNSLSFTLLAEPSLQAIHPESGPVGSEVRIQTGGDARRIAVYFGPHLATIRSAEPNQLVVVVPEISEPIPESGLLLPVKLHAGDQEISGSIDFKVERPAAEPPPVFQLTFAAKPSSGNLGFNESIVETNIGPLLVLVAKDTYGNSMARAEAVAKTLNDSVQLFQNDPTAKINLVKETPLTIRAETGSGKKVPILHVFSDDALAYSKINKRPINTAELAEWWKALLDSYFKVFVQIQSPGDTGVLGSAGLVLENIYRFYSNWDNRVKYYRKDFLDSLPPDQKTKLLSLSLSLPRRLTSVNGKWGGRMSNILYPKISDPDLDIVLTLNQKDGSVTGRIEVNWKLVYGESGGGFQNVAYRSLGTYEISGTYSKNKSYPFEFSFVEKESRRLNFVGKLEGNQLRGRFLVSGGTGEGSWSAIPKE